MRQSRRNKGPVVVSETTEEGEAGGEVVANVLAGSYSFRLKPKYEKDSLVATQTPLSRQLETWAAALSSGRFLFQERGMQLNSFYDIDFT
jgi:hypothetical protein